MVYVDEVNDLFMDYKYVCKRMNKFNTMLQKPTKRMYFDEFFKMHKSFYEKYDDYNIIVTSKIYDRSTQLLWVYDNKYYEISLLVCIGISVLMKVYFDWKRMMPLMVAYNLNR